MRCSAATATTATWSWDAADRAHSYWFRYSSGDNWAEAGGAEARSHTRTGITPNGGHGGWANWRYVDVVARNNVGDSRAKRASCLTLSPRWLRVSCSAAGQITATWKRALGLEDAPSVEFTATAVPVDADGADGEQLQPYTGTDRRYTVAGTPGTQYRVTVRTAPVAGYPVYTETRTKQCKPAAPTGVEVECTSANRVVVRWSPAVGADSYRVSVTGRTQAPASTSVDDHPNPVNEGRLYQRGIRRSIHSETHRYSWHWMGAVHRNRNGDVPRPHRQLEQPQLLRPRRGLRQRHPPHRLDRERPLPGR